MPKFRIRLEGIEDVLQTILVLYRNDNMHSTLSKSYNDVIDDVIIKLLDRKICDFGK